MIKKGETKTFSYNVDLLQDFGFVDGDGKHFLEAGDYYIMVKDKKAKVELD